MAEMAYVAFYTACAWPFLSGFGQREILGLLLLMVMMRRDGKGKQWSYRVTGHMLSNTKRFSLSSAKTTLFVLSIALLGCCKHVAMRNY